MVVWHVISYKKLKKYIDTGFILPPVRAWENFEQAENMSRSTGRRIILRLKFPDNADILDGHFGQARVIHYKLKIESL